MVLPDSFRWILSVTQLDESRCESVPHSPAPLRCPGYKAVLGETDCSGVGGKEGEEEYSRAEFVFLCVVVHLFLCMSLGVTVYVCVCLSVCLCKILHGLC